MLLDTIQQIFYVDMHKNLARSMTLLELYYYLNPSLDQLQ